MIAPLASVDERVVAPVTPNVPATAILVSSFAEVTPSSAIFAVVTEFEASFAAVIELSAMSAVADVV